MIIDLAPKYVVYSRIYFAPSWKKPFTYTKQFFLKSGSGRASSVCSC